MKRYLTTYVILLLFLSSSIVLSQTDTNVVKTDTTIVNTDTTITNIETESVDESAPVDVPRPVLNETNSFILNKWELSEYRENGKIEELPDYVIELFEDGTYSAIEEEDIDYGTWNLGENNSSIIFDDNTQNREVWNIVSLEPKKIMVRFMSEGKAYEYTFIPWVKRVQK